MSEESKRNISNGLKEYYRTHASKNKGRKLTPEQINKLQQGFQKYIKEYGGSGKGRKLSPEHKKALLLQ